MIVVADTGPHSRLRQSATGFHVLQRGSVSFPSKPTAFRRSRTNWIWANALLLHSPGVIHADLLLIDDAAGRAEAKRRNLRVTGTLGVLRAAAERGLVNVPELVARLKATTFYADEALLKSAFDQWLK